MRRDRLELLLASFLMLFVELVLIRWAGAYVVYLSYFSNFILLGSFLGIGVGFLRAKKGPDLFRWAPFALVVLTGLVKGLPVVIDRSGGDLIYFGSLTTTGLPAWVMLPFLFVASAGVMAMIAHGVAVRFARFTPLEAYRLDIGGSLLGVVAYSVLALLGAPPLVWAVVIGALFWLLLEERRMVQTASLVALAALFAIGTFQGDVIWSPYYRVEVFENRGVRVNGIPHQQMIRTPGTPYDIPYERVAAPIRDVLVIGAGNGNDVSAALRAGATHVDAVEIDPVLQRLGEERHPERPYSDSRVRPVIDDGRAFLERTAGRYDLIVFALPDSLTLVSGQSAVRLESYLFTIEAFEAARAHLRPSGAFAMYNFYRERWLLDRLGGSLKDVFGPSPCLALGPDTRTGDVGGYAMLIASSDRSSLRCERTWSPAGEVVSPATDDRPFVYLRERTIPSRYLWTLALVLGASTLLVRIAGGRFRAMGSALDLFFMGAAFLLLETKSVVQFALLFGTTWFVNALVFFGILLTVLLAIEVERRVRIGRPGLLFGLLFLGLLLAGLVPAESLLEMSVVPRFVVATALAFFPVFVANLVFAERFRDAEDPTTAFGANLLGAMVGGALEYTSLVTGYRALLILAAALYALAWFTGGRKIGATREATGAIPRPELVSQRRLP
jgi:hypothetical protein